MPIGSRGRNNSEVVREGAEIIRPEGFALAYLVPWKHFARGSQRCRAGAGQRRRFSCSRLCLSARELCLICQM